MHSTQILSGKKLPKNAPTIEALGTLDELQAHIFLIISKNPQEEEQFQRIGKNLYKIMSAISREEDMDLTEEILLVKQKIGEFNEVNKFSEFNEKELSAQMNISRTICRRAERRVLNLSEKPKKILDYLNKLSLLLFHFAIGAKN